MVTTGGKRKVSLVLFSMLMCGGRGDGGDDGDMA